MKDLLLSSALAWLRYQHRCFLVATERHPLGDWNHGRPDALGADGKRFITEVEIKITVSDFRANAKKRHIKNRNWNSSGAPRQFYFMVPPLLVEKVRPELPEYAGLMTIEEHGFMPGVKEVRVIRSAPVNRSASPLTVRQLYLMAKHQSGTLCSMARFLAVKTPNL